MSEKEYMINLTIAEMELAARVLDAATSGKAYSGTAEQLQNSKELSEYLKSSANMRKYAKEQTEEIKEFMYHERARAWSAIVSTDSVEMSELDNPHALANSI